MFSVSKGPPKAPEADLTECRAGPVENAGAGRAGAAPCWILAAKYHLLLLWTIM